MAKHYPKIGQQEGKKEEVQAMFDAIASRYDFLNRLLSLGIDQRWRKAVVDALRPHAPQRVLDVATGTADLAIAAAALDPTKIVGVDIAEQMLERGREKIAAAGLADRITLRPGDAERLPFSDRQFDAVTVAFGVRNFEDLQRGLTEIHRVMRPGGQIAVLEFSRPRRFPMKQLFRFYTGVVLPRVGRAVSKDEGAYQYLPDSIREFPDGEAFLDELREAGFEQAAAERLTLGVASLYTARKPEEG